LAGADAGRGTSAAEAAGLPQDSIAAVNCCATPRHSLPARRGNTGYGCYFITASTFQKRNILQSDRMAGLFLDVLLHYRGQGKYLLHEFVVMPDHSIF
jgi:hypothetical protein